MTPVRTPVIELDSQAYNRRKLPSRSQRYGKPNRNGAPLAPLWASSPSDDSKFEDLSARPQTETLQLIQKREVVGKQNPSKSASLGEIFEKLGIESPCGDESPVPQSKRNHTPVTTNPRSLCQNIERRRRRTTKSKVAERTAEAKQVDLDVAALLNESNTNQITKFDDFACRISDKYDIKKHAEGSYGDVYKLSKRSPKAHRPDKVQRLGGCVLKIIPLCAASGKGSRKFTQVDDAVREVKLLKRLDAVHGFTRFRDVHIVQGGYPTVFQRAFHDFVEAGGQSQNIRPEKAFKPNQYFAILEMDDAGTDLESLQQPNIFQIHDIFWSCAFILAHGESSVEFEPRDMHIGNICVRPFVLGCQIDVCQDKVKTWPQDQVRHLGLTEIRVTLIDYTISRANFQGTAMFNDLKRGKFFRSPVNTMDDAPELPAIKEWPIRDELAGDQQVREDALQQRAYYQMRDMVKATSNNKKEDWALFVPRTNIVWLAYLLELELRRHDGHDVKGSNEYCARAQSLMREKLISVLKALKLSIRERNNSIGSAEQLLEVAVQNAWLENAEVKHYAEMLETEA